MTQVSSSVRKAAALVAVVFAAAAAPAAALAYWDFQGNLSSGASYGEAQAGTTGYWNIRLSRANCNADSWLRQRSTGNWVWYGAPCSVSDYTTNYPLANWNASHALNGGSGSVWVNVRIAGSV